MPPSWKSVADALAAQRGGVCLSPQAPSVKTRLLWKCGDPTHQAWQATLADLRGRPSRKGSWCKRCHFIGQRQYHIEDVRQFLEQRQITLNSDEYKDTKTRIMCCCLRCAHEWQTTFNAIQQGRLCPKCAIRRRATNSRISQKRAFEIFSKREIAFLEPYKDSNTNGLCRCNRCGHSWRTNLSRVSSGVGCPKCGIRASADKRRFSQQYVVELLSTRSITLLGQYKNSAAPMPCRCEVCSHKWSARLASIIHQDQGCPNCAGRIPKGKVDYAKLAAQHNGNVRTIARRAEYVSTWICEKGHEFSRSYENIRTTGTFCTICSGWHPKKLANYQALARKFGGQLRKAASNVNRASVWLCKHGHKFSRSYYKIDEFNRFCPTCSARLGERLCRKAAEQLFGVPFEKVKLKNLRGTGGGYLELDAFNGDLRLAIEHHGAQHFEPVSSWGGEEQLRRQQEHDRLKREYCCKHGITLIEIRELGVVTPIETLKDHFKKECVRQKVPLPANYDGIEICLSEIALQPEEEKLFDRFKSQAAQKGFQVLSTAYLGSQACHVVKCVRGHEFRIRPFQALRLKGCPVCYKLQRAKLVKLSDGVVFPSVAAAARKLGVSSAAIGYAIRHKTRCRGFLATYIEAL